MKLFERSRTPVLAVSVWVWAIAIPPAQPAEAPFELKDIDYWTVQCRSLFGQQQYAEALVACEKALALNPNPKQKDVEIWKLRSHALFKLGRYRDAIGSYDYVLSSEPNYSIGLTYRCHSLFQLAQYEAALAACEQALTRDGNWETLSPGFAWYTQGLIQRQRGQIDDALAAYDRAVIANPDDSLAWAERCETLASANRYGEAQDQCDRALRRSETNWTLQTPALAWYKRGLVYQQLANQQPVNQQLANQQLVNQQLVNQQLVNQQLVNQQLAKLVEAKASFDQAVLLYERAIAANPNDPFLWTEQGIVLETLRQNERALTAYDRATQILPNYSRALATRCGVLNRLKQFQPALTACDNALKGDSVWGETAPGYAWQQRSSAQVGLKQYPDAIASAERAIALNSQDAAAWNTKAIAQIGLNQYSAAVTAAQQATELNKTAADAWNTQAIALWHLKDYAKAAAASEQAVSLNPKSSRAQFARGRILSSIGANARDLNSYEAAIAAYKLALEGDLDDRDTRFKSEIYTNQAAAYFHLKQYNDAQQAIEQATQLNPQSFEAWYNTGLIFNQLGQFPAAIVALDRANALFPNSVQVLTEKGKALSTLDPLRAIATFEAALSINPNYQPAQEGRDRVRRRINPKTQSQTPKESF